MCQRKSQNLIEDDAKIKTQSAEVIKGFGFVDMFLLFFGRHLLKDIILAQTNKTMEGEDVSFGEFLRYIGIWVFYQLLLTLNALFFGV